MAATRGTIRFTLTQDTVVTVDLASASAGVAPYLYLIRGAGADGTIIDGSEGAGASAQIARVLRPGEYTIEATTISAGATGSFTLEIDAWRQNVCVVEKLGEFSGMEMVSRTGTWAQRCDSPNRAARYARHYSFTLTQDTIVTVDLTSPSPRANPYLYLMWGAGVDGAIIDFDDDGGEGNNAQIARALQPGEYTIEATTNAVRSTGELHARNQYIALERVRGECGNTFRYAEGVSRRYVGPGLRL